MLDSEEEDDELENKPVDMIMKDGIVYSASNGGRKQTEEDSSQVSDNSCFHSYFISCFSQNRKQNNYLISN